MTVPITLDDAIALRAALESTRDLIRQHPGHAHDAARAGARATGAAVPPGVIECTLNDLGRMCDRVIAALHTAIDADLEES